MTLKFSSLVPSFGVIFFRVCVERAGSGLLNDLWAVEAATEISWPVNGAAGQFIQVYDWDTIVLYPGIENIVQERIELCSRFYPCKFFLVGSSNASTLERKGNGSLACLLNSGCSIVSLNNATVLCDGRTATYSAVDVDSATVKLQSVTFSQCSSQSDGSAVRCYGAGGAVYIDTSDFYRAFSFGTGGAISSVGCSVHISNTSFRSCVSFGGGGAVSAAPFQCYGADIAMKNVINISHSRFEGCGSQSNGGALSVSSLDVIASICTSEFSSCWSNMSGGAISATEKGSVIVADSVLHMNIAEESGGAVALTQSATVEAFGSIFSFNMANNGDGGAIYASDAQLVLRDSLAFGNRASSGAGGAVFWDGSIRPLLTERAMDVVGTNVSFCHVDNFAIYGNCLASAYSWLEVQSMPLTVFSGLSFSMVVVKKDAYNQTILTDSESVLQATATIDHNYLPDSYVGLSGTYISNLESGRASFSMIIKPSYTKIDSEINLARLKTNPAIYFKGLDAETSKNMLSVIVPIMIQTGEMVCPPGFILVLEQARAGANQTAFQGGCSLCGSGTYSINPLAGTTTSTPTCFTCPSTATCSGGNDVRFSLGTWTISHGMYILVACPSGHQLVNSVGGVFSLEVQGCVACASDQYILDTNNSNFTCEACPIGAVCDGNSLKSRVEGAVWTGDKNTGIYHLVGCPAGYEMQSATLDGQQCLLCPATYYCVGGSNPRIPCSDGTFAPAGTNASSYCMPVVYVAVVLTLPYTQDEFTLTLQTSLEEALAAASGVDAGYVTISSVSATSRRSSGASIQVFVLHIC